MCVAMHGVRLEGTSGRRNNLAKLVVCGNWLRIILKGRFATWSQSDFSCFLSRTEEGKT